MNLRYHERYDIDLISILSSGINITQYLPIVLRAYARGEECHLLAQPCVLKIPPQTIRASVLIDDPESVELLKKVRPGYQNAFCKMLLRESLIGHSLSPFFEGEYVPEPDEKSFTGDDLSNVPGIVIRIDKKDKRQRRSKPETGEMRCTRSKKSPETAAPVNASNHTERKMAEAQEELFDVFKSLMA